MKQPNRMKKNCRVIKNPDLVKLMLSKTDILYFFQQDRVQHNFAVYLNIFN